SNGWSVGDFGTIVFRQASGMSESHRVPVREAGAIVWPSPAVRTSSVRLVAELPSPRVRVVAADGRVVRELEQAGEENLFRWDLRDYYRQLVVPGVYFYRIVSGSQETSLPVVVIQD
ncbi:MAG: T9SS type A sorting domain-containing protein, partial [candidate division WOR-3 bacterium]